jgi:hypothetical protein
LHLYFFNLPGGLDVVILTILSLQSNFGTALRFPFRVVLFLQQFLRQLAPPQLLQSRSLLNPAPLVHAATARSGTECAPILTTVAPDSDIAGLVQRFVVPTIPLPPRLHKRQEHVGMAMLATECAPILTTVAPDSDIAGLVQRFVVPTIPLLPRLHKRQEHVAMAMLATVSALSQATVAPNLATVVQVPVTAQVLQSLVLRQ